MSTGKGNIACNNVSICGSAILLIIRWFEWFGWGSIRWREHTTAPKVNTCTCKLIQPLIGGKHLA